jgi:hypothetical protein
MTLNDLQQMEADLKETRERRVAVSANTKDIDTQLELIRLAKYALYSGASA